MKAILLGFLSRKFLFSLAITAAVVMLICKGKILNEWAQVIGLIGPLALYGILNILDTKNVSVSTGPTGTTVTETDKPGATSGPN